MNNPHLLPCDTHKVIHYDLNQKWLNTAKVEETKNGKYIGEFSLPTHGGGWCNHPVSIFWQEEAHPQGSNYFGIFLKTGHDFENSKVMITDGLKAAQRKWNGLLNTATNEVLYSAYRHDYQSHNGLIVDGGPEYFRHSVGENFVPVTLVFEKDKIIVDDTSV